MARTSKKKQLSQTYSVGIYARLSVDSNERKNESIETQIEIAKAYVYRQEDMDIFDCYIDVGRTGTDFHREGFERMMRDVRKHKINCIIVKDLSRFGRNYIETGNYIEKIFPFMGVRFIAVTDEFDSIKIFGQSERLGINLKNLVNEMYAKDIALKVKSGKIAQREQGSYTGGVAPFGYRAEWRGDKKCLLIDENTSDIVKKIYEMFLSGKNMKEIVIWLYEKRIVRPTQYHKTGQIYSPKGGKLQEWSRGTVKAILTNPVYTGCLVQGRTCRSVQEHTHEPLISEDTFFKAAEKFEKTSIYYNKDGDLRRIPIDADPFADVLFCGDCGKKMRRISAIKQTGFRTKVRIYSYNCPMTAHIDEEKCAAKSITLQTLSKIVRTAIRQEFALSAMRPGTLVESSSMEAEKIKKEWRKKLIELERKMEHTRKIESEQYLRYRMGETDESNFKYQKEENDKKVLIYQKKYMDITENLQTIDSETAQRNRFLRALVRGNEKTELTTEVINMLISRIEVCQDHRIRILFRFKRSEIQIGKGAF